MRDVKALILRGYYQVSRSYRQIARLPEGKTGRQLLAEMPEYKHMTTKAGLNNASLDDFWLRMFAFRDPEFSLTLTVEEFAEFRRLGGKTRY